jgi:hypothetical protein
MHIACGKYINFSQPCFIDLLNQNYKIAKMVEHILEIDLDTF